MSNYPDNIHMFDDHPDSPFYEADQDEKPGSDLATTLEEWRDEAMTLQKIVDDHDALIKAMRKVCEVAVRCVTGCGTYDYDMRIALQELEKVRNHG